MSRTRRRVTSQRAVPSATCALTGRPAEPRDAIVRMFGLGFEALVLADPFFERFVNPYIRSQNTPGHMLTTRNQRALRIPGLKPVTGRVRTDCYEFNLGAFINTAPVPMVSNFYEQLAKDTALGDMFERSTVLDKLLDANARAPRKKESVA